MIRLALVGDYRPDAVAHQAIPKAVQLAAHALQLDVSPQWLPTASITNSGVLQEYDALWLTPGSPYINDEGAFLTLRYARENNVPFLGSCGGFQYAIVEYARNVMGWSDAGHAETDSGGRLVIAPLSCSLVEKTGDIVIEPGSLLAQAYGKTEISEGYHCSFGVNPDFVADLTTYPLRLTAWDREGDVRAMELPGHTFYVATLFQSERAALRDELSPLVVEMLRAAR